MKHAEAQVSRIEANLEIPSMTQKRALMINGSSIMTMVMEPQPKFTTM